MFRVLLLFLVFVAVGFAQDRARMSEVVKVQSAGDRFIGSLLVAKDDAVVFEQSTGCANIEWKVPNTSTTKFRIGSVTKQFTAAAILLLEEQGRLDVDDLLSKFVPSVPDSWKKVTLHHLLTHSSGIPSSTDLPEYKTWKMSPGTPEQMMAHIRDIPLDFAPGEKFKYSNSGYVLLGWVVELVSGQRYETFLRERIFKPLGMSDSGYDSNSAIIQQRASGYVQRADGLANAPYIDMHVPGGAGALYSTTRDLLRWTQGLFGGKLLSADSLEKMTTPYKDNYALGLVVNTVNGRKMWAHGGSIEGFNSQLTYYPESKVTVVVLANVNGRLCDALAAQLAAITFGETVTLNSERKEMVLPPAILQGYVGVYQLGPQFPNTIRLTDGQLTTQLSGQSALPLFAESEKKFFLKVVDAQIEFVTDEHGHVTHLLQTQNGRTQKAPRISDTVAERKAIVLSRAALEANIGIYELKPGLAVEITLEGDQLMSQATGQGKFPIFAESPTTFFFTVVDAQIDFVSDPEGAVTHLVLHQGGHDIKGIRKP